MPNHRAESLISSNGSGASTMYHKSGLRLVEESRCHRMLHDSCRAVFVKADLLGYICVSNLTIEWNSLESLESIKRSESARIMVLLFNNESERQQ